ncbi:hypothetical protein D7V64_15845 [Acinetobacter cumulans]|uniref:Uncharacterized protein n=1 Tax=Acinetobacter cumulans TaxID=2136182 RepID=A0A3A8FMR2_9GAMM|nr:MULTISPECIES: hypothetical protein [Acinetobacter]PZT84256.1 MAG: hypothetical protein DI627_16405 [Acinetobacter sp.]RKG48032.1 hypothetical protein D7V64_15845 [Acinetobacter cumulans]
MKIGIFWYWNCEVLGIAHNFSPSDIDSIGLADSNYAHVEYWKIIQSTNKELKYMEYEEVPRGRVIFNSKLNKIIIYTDKRLLIRSRIEKIARFFEANSEQIVVRSDPHYKTK